MELASSPAPGSRVQELGDRVVVRFRPRRSWGETVFLVAWLTLWTSFGLEALGDVRGAEGDERFILLIWLCGWAIGEGATAWRDFGLTIAYGDEAVRVGEGMSERDADDVVAIVLSTIRPRTGWIVDERDRAETRWGFARDDAEGPADPVEPTREEDATQRPRAWWRFVPLAALVAVVLVAQAVRPAGGDEEETHTGPGSSGAAPGVRPVTAGPPVT